MSLWDAYKKVKAAVDSAYGETHDLGTVRVADGFITANDSRMLACAPIDIEANFAVSAAALEKCFKRFEAPKISIAETMLTVSEGRTRARIMLLDPRRDDAFKLDSEALTPAPDGVVSALATLRPFMCDDLARQSLCGIHFEDGRASATNGMVIAQVDTPSFSAGVTLPEWLVQYLLRRDDAITDAYVTENQIGFRFDDGSYVVSQRFASDMQVGQINRVVEQKFVEPETEISGDLRQALKDAIDFADDAVLITPDAVKTERGVTQFSTDVETVATEETTWSPKLVAAMLTAATHFDPRVWPEPCSWRGATARGLIVGRK